MKKILINSVFLLFTTLLFAQEDCYSPIENSPCCNGIIRTDPRNNAAFNPEWSQMINYFNWMDPNWMAYFPPAGYNVGSSGMNLGNPFHTSFAYLQHVNCYNTNCPSSTYNNIDYWPEQGWELLYVNNGYIQNQSAPNLLQVGDELRPGPIVMLYNKYTATLRVITSFELQPSDKFITHILFKSPVNNANAMLNQYGEYARSLDQITKVTEIASSSVGGVIGKGWMVTEFKIAYDPCVCIHASDLIFKFTQENSTDIKLQGRFTGTMKSVNQVNDTGPYNSSNSTDGDFLTGVSLKEGTVVKSGMLTYYDLKSLIDKYKAQQFNGTENNNIDIIRQAINGSNQHVNHAAYNGIIHTWSTDYFNNIDPVVVNAFTSVDSYGLGLGLIAKGAKFLISALFRGDDNSSDNAISSNVHYIEGNMEMSGTITHTTGILNADVVLVTPGSLGSADQTNVDWTNYPRYNEPLGLFALLKKPTLIKSEGWYPNDPNGGMPGNVMKLESDLVFAFNPSAEINIEKTTIHAAIVFESGEEYSTAPERIGDFNKGGKIPTPVPPSSPSIIRTEYITDFYPLSCLEKGVFTSKDEQSFNIGNTNYRIKLLINYEFKENIYGVINHSVQELTFQFNVKTSPDPSYWTEQPYFLEENMLYLSGNTYTQNTVEKALNTIIISGNIYSTGGVTDIIAGERIIVEDGVQIGPNVNLKIEFGSGCVSDLVEPVTPSHILSFCGNGEFYKANIANKRSNSVLDGNNEKEEVFIRVQPNPANQYVNIVVKQKRNDDIVVWVSDYSGRIIKQLRTYRPQDIILLSIENLANGLYFVHVQMGEIHQVKKLVVSH